MAENSAGTRSATWKNDLRKNPVFADIPQADFDWLADKFEEVQFQPGEIMARPGDAVDHLNVILEGELRVQRSSDADSPIFIGYAGQVTGLLPFSRLTKYPGTARAISFTRIARLHRQFFPEMLHRIPELGQRLVGIMSDRIRETTRLENQREKLMALGKLSAGLAHELNNPAAAAQRATASLRETLETVRNASIRLARHALTTEQRELIIGFEKEAGQLHNAPLDPLAQNDREESVTAWLEARHLAEPWKVAPVLVDADVSVPKLEALATEVGDAVLSDALTRITSIVTITKLISEIEISTRRISDLVRAIKEYSYMDQAAMQEVDVQHGIENTLTILNHRLKKGVRVVREFAPGLPKICAYGSELNQIWTNLICNAIEAMHGEGELHVKTAVELDRIRVEIEDNGPGIPKEVLPRIFEPFFTTKDVGEGTGLGLDTVSRIVRNHHGEIRVESRTGDTRFLVYLPLTQPKASATSN